MKKFRRAMFKVIKDLAEFRSLESEWIALAKPFKTPLLQYEWFLACAEAFCPPDQLHIIIKYSEDGIDAIAPLALEKAYDVNKVGFLGASVLGEPSGFIYRNEESLEDLIFFLLRLKKPVNLMRFNASLTDTLSIQKLHKRSSFILFKDCNGSPFIPIDKTWEQFQSGLSSHRRYDLRRALKRAEQLGDIQFEIICPESGSLDHYLQEIFNVEAAGWKGRKGTALLLDKRLKRFITFYSKAASRLRTLRLCFLRINKRPVAVLLAVQYFNSLWVLKIGYDEEFSKCSPGILLINKTIKYAFQNRLDTYEFLGSDDPWIRIWTEQKHPYITVRIYPYSISGQYCLVKDVASAASKKALKKCRH